ITITTDPHNIALQRSCRTGHRLRAIYAPLAKQHLFSLAPSTNASHSCGYGRPRSALAQLFDDFRNDFDRAIDLRVSVEPAKRETQTPTGAVAARIHCAQQKRSFLRTGPRGRAGRAINSLSSQQEKRRRRFDALK